MNYECVGADEIHDTWPRVEAACRLVLMLAHLCVFDYWQVWLVFGVIQISTTVILYHQVIAYPPFIQAWHILRVYLSHKNILANKYMHHSLVKGNINIFCISSHCWISLRKEIMKPAVKCGQLTHVIHLRH